MPRILKIKGASSDASVRPFLAVPSYGDMPATFVASLWETQIALSAAGYSATLQILSGNCHVDDSRNLLVRDFLESDCTDLIFLDSDLGWNGESVIRLLQADRDIVAGIYPLKQVEEDFPVLAIPGKAMRAEADGCVEVEGVPTGFLRIRRRVFEKLEEGADKFKTRKDTEKNRPIAIIFERGFSRADSIEGCRRIGGDYNFCRKARAAGFSVHVLPDISFEHSGENGWTGNLASFWRRKNGVTEKVWHMAFNELKRGEITPENIAGICEHWGNIPWAAGAGMVSAYAQAAKDCGGDILECGSGLTSLVAAAMNSKNTVYALEHDEIWAARMRKAARELDLTNLRIIDTSIVENWYALPEDFPKSFSLIMVDGPPRGESDRFKIRESGIDVTGSTVFFDDIDQELMTECVDKFAKEFGGLFRIIEHPTKNFAICAFPEKEKQAA